MDPLPQESQQVSPIPSSTNPTAPSQKKSKKMLFVLLFLLAVAFTGAVAYVMGGQNVFMQKSQVTVTPGIAAPTPTPGRTAEWKTYESKYGYSFKYPETWGVKDSVGDFGAQIWSNPSYFALSEEEKAGFAKQDFAKITVSFYFEGTDTAYGSVSAQTELGDFVRNRYEDALLDAKETTLDGMSALLVTVQRQVVKPEYPVTIQSCPRPDGACFENIGTTQALWQKRDGDILVIEDWYGRDYAETAKLQNTFSDFIASFQFTY